MLNAFGHGTVDRGLSSLPWGLQENPEKVENNKSLYKNKIMKERLLCTYCAVGAHMGDECS